VSFFDMEQEETDRYGRYLLDVDGQGVKPYSRVSTMARILEDEYHLTQWKIRTTLHGAAQRADLMQRAAFTPPSNKEAYAEIIREAETLGGATAKRSQGSGFHAAREIPEFNPHTPTAQAHPEIARALVMYHQEMAAHRITLIPELREVQMASPRLGVAGTADGFAKMLDGTVRVLDDKTGSTDYPHGFAIQLAFYANMEYAKINGQWYPISVIEQHFGPIAKDWALLVHVSLGENPSVDVQDLDIYSGWQGAMLSFQAREWRKRKDLLRPHAGVMSGWSPTPAAAQQPTAAAAPPAPAQAPRPPMFPEAVAAGERAARLAAAPAPASPYLQAVAAETAGMANPVQAAYEQAAGSFFADRDPSCERCPGPCGGEPLEHGVEVCGDCAALPPAPAVPQPAPLSGPALTHADVQQQQSAEADVAALLKAYKTKPVLQAAAVELNPTMPVTRTRKNLAADMVKDPAWLERRGQILGTENAARIAASITDGSPKPGEIVSQTGVTVEELPGPGQPSQTVRAAAAGMETAIGGLRSQVDAAKRERGEQISPGQPPAPPVAVPTAAPSTPEEDLIARIAAATDQNVLAALWQEAMDNGGWTPRMQDAAAIVVKNFQ
jgi:hypothetical protein